MQRRDWIKKVGAGSALAVPSGLLTDSYSAYDEAVAGLVGKADIKPDSRIELLVPEAAANGAVVPVGVESGVPATLRLVLLVDNHHRAKVAELDTSSAMLAPKLKTHLQLLSAATITALVETPTGWHSNSIQVKSLGESCKS